MRPPLLALALLAALPAAAQTVSDPAACEALAERDPAAAVEAAQAWARAGGGAPALICEALALADLGAHATAALRLETLAAAEGAPEADRAALYEVAAGFRLLDGQPAEAHAAATAGLALAPTAALHRIRAEAAAELGDPAAARADLNQALAAAPDDLAARLLRARLRREAGEPAAALEDAEAALRIAPDSPAAWSGKAEAEAALGRRPAARESFLRAIALDRDGRAGAEARAGLQRMELN